MDLLVGELLGGAKETIAGVADGDVDLPDGREAPFHHLANRPGIGDVQHLHAQQLRIPLDEVGDAARSLDGADDVVASVEKLLGDCTAKAAADARDEPGSLGHVSPCRDLRGPRADRSRRCDDPPCLVAITTW